MPKTTSAPPWALLQHEPPVIGIFFFFFLGPPVSLLEYLDGKWSYSRFGFDLSSHCTKPSNSWWFSPLGFWIPFRGGLMYLGVLKWKINQDLWWPKPSGTSSREEKFGLPIYLLVGFLALLLDMASNAVLIVQSNSFFSQA